MNGAVLQVWNDMRVSNDNFIFGWSIPLNNDIIRFLNEVFSVIWFDWLCVCVSGEVDCTLQ